ncbi:unnamed protein product, partial [Choristocarpus tenellus]
QPGWVENLAQPSGQWPVPILPGSRRSSDAGSFQDDQLPVLISDSEVASPSTVGGTLGGGKGQVGEDGNGRRRRRRCPSSAGTWMGESGGYAVARGDFGVDGWEGGVPLALDKRPKP